MTTHIIIICAKESSELALELALVYAMMHTPTHLIGWATCDTESPNLKFFKELGGQVHDVELSTVLAPYPTAQIIRL